MNKKVIYSLAVSAALVLSGCGWNNSDDDDDSTEGSVEASKLQNITVCVKGEDICTKTAYDGYFSLNKKAPFELELKIGNSVLGSVVAGSNYNRITPLVLANHDPQLSAMIGAFLHKVAGCDMNDVKCDFSNINNVDLNNSENDNLSLIDKLTLAVGTNLDLGIIKDGNLITLTQDDINRYASANPEMVDDSIGYQGAATVGDLTYFKYDPKNNMVAYNIVGPVFNNVYEGAIRVENVYNNMFFVDNYSNMYFFSKNLGMAITNINNAEDNGANVAVSLGVKIPLQTNVNLAKNKRFNIIDLNSSGDVSFKIMDFNISADGNNTWNSFDANGTWGINDDNSSFKFFDSEGNLTKHFAIKQPATLNGREMIIVDNITGGFGVGVEAKPLTASDINGTFYYQRVQDDGVLCYGEATFNNNSISVTDKYCMQIGGNPDPDSKVSYTKTLELNPVIDPDNNITLTGLAKVIDDTNATYLFVDPKEGFLVEFDTNTKSITFGSNQPLKVNP